MAEKNPIQKTLNYIDKHGLEDLFTLNEAGGIDVDVELFEKTALADAGITMDQYKKLEKSKGELIPAATHVGGQLAAQAFKANPELTETGFSFHMGTSQKVGALFDRD